MYGIYFFLLYGILRSLLFEAIDDIWEDDMPNVDRIYKIILEVYVAREMKCYELEEYLFAKLIFIIRSRELCIRMSYVRDEELDIPDSDETPRLEILEILAMYGFYFLVAFSILRENFFSAINRIWLNDMPNVNRIYHNCLEIYLVRDMKCYEMEEELFANLIFIMRSRELCIKLTRMEDDPYNPIFIMPSPHQRRITQ